jgi:hypothetical protein
MVESFNDQDDLPYPVEKLPSDLSSFRDDEPEEQWQMSHATDPFIQSGELPEIQKEVPKVINALNQEINDWGMSVPGVIGADTSSPMELPPVINTKVEMARAPEVKVGPPQPTSGAQKFPDNTDLDYPSLKDFAQPEVKAEKPDGKKSQLVPLETLNNSLELELEGNYVENTTDIGSLEAQIHDEVAEDLWHADEFEDLKQQVSSKIEEMKSGFQPSRNDFDESLFKPVDDSDSITWNDVNSDIFAKPKFDPTVTTNIASTDEIMNKIRPEMEDLVKKYVKEYMDEMFRKNVEKISWEVIPDLAENLIRQELAKIADKIIAQAK